MFVTTKSWAGALLLALASTACLAESLGFAASSASSAGSASVGSLSDSFRGSSNSSSRKNDVAEGDYRLIEVAQAPDRPQLLRLTLQQGDAAPVTLDVPPAALAQRALAAGDAVRATHRPYGVEFAYADTRTAFFLALDDDWKRELGPHALTL